MEMGGGGGGKIKDFSARIEVAGEGWLRGVRGLSSSQIWAKGQQHQPFSLLKCVGEAQNLDYLTNNQLASNFNQARFKLHLMLL